MEVMKTSTFSQEAPRQGQFSSYPVAGQAPVVIEQQVQLDGSLGAAELRPIEN